jgi:hypothetical protein
MEIPYHELEKVKIKNPFVNSQNHSDNLCSKQKIRDLGYHRRVTED